jgi:hypothetical protein
VTAPAHLDPAMHADMMAAELMMAADDVRTLIVWTSRNAKTGPTTSTYRPQSSCPRSCPLWASGACYAMQRGAGGSPGAFGHAERAAATAADVAAMGTDPRAGDVWRFNVSGDYLAPDGSPDLDYIDATNTAVRARAAAGRPVTVLAYTPAWRILSPSMFAYTVRASCDTLLDVAQATAAGWSAVLVVPEDDPDAVLRSRVGPVRMVPCVNQLPAKRTCDACKLCARDTAGTSAVVFRAHGAKRRRVLPVVTL